MTEDTQHTYSNDVYLCFGDSDADFAESLESALEAYVVPRPLGFPHRHLRLFQDSPELSSSEYADILTQQLKASRKTIVFCSNGARFDIPFNDKIRAFLESHGGTENLILVTNRPGSVERLLPEIFSERDALPPLIRFERLNPEHDHPDQPPFSDAWFALLGGIFGKQPADMREYERRHHRRVMRNRIAAVSLVLLAALAFFVYSWMTGYQAGALEERTAEAEKLYRQSQVAANENHPLLRLHLLAAALARNPAPEWRIKLRDELQTNWPAAQQIARLAHPEPVRGAVIHSDSSRILVWGGRLVTIWDLAAGASRETIRLEADDQINGAMWLDDQRVMSWCNDGEVVVWANNGTKTQRFPHDAGVVAVTLSPDGAQLLTVSDDFTARLWDFATQRLIGACPHDGWVGGAIFHPDGKEFLTWSDDSTARRWHSRDATAIRSFRLSGSGNGAGYHPRKSQLLVWATDGTLQQFRVDGTPVSGGRLRHDDRVIGARYIRGGEAILSWGADDTARLWNALTGKAVGQPFIHEGWVFGAEIRAEKLLTWSYDNSAALWALSDQRRLFHYRHRSLGLTADAGVYAAQFLSGDMVISAGADGEWRLWHSTDDRSPAAVMAHHRPVEASPQDFPPGAVYIRQKKLLLTWSGDAQVKLWQLSTAPDLTALSVMAIPAALEAASGVRWNTDSGLLEFLE